MTGITKGARVVFPVTVGGSGRANHRTMYREGTVVSTWRVHGAERARIREDSDLYARGRGYFTRPAAVLAPAASPAGQQRLAEGTWNDRYTEWEGAGKPVHPWHPLVPGATACWQCGHQQGSAYHRRPVSDTAGTAGPACTGPESRYSDTEAINDIHAVLTGASCLTADEAAACIAEIVARTERRLDPARPVTAEVTGGTHGMPVARVDADGTVILAAQDPDGAGVLVQVTTRDAAEADGLVITVDGRFYDSGAAAGRLRRPPLQPRACTEAALVSDRDEEAGTS